MKLTKDTVATLRAPAGIADYIAWDDTLPGFGVRLRGNTRRFVCQYRVGGGRQRRETLGDVRKIDLDAARKIARQRFALVELGTDPVATKAEAANAAVARLSLAAVVERYLDAKKPPVLRPNTHDSLARYFRLQWRPLHSRPLVDIKRTEIAARLQEIVKQHGRASATQSRAKLAALFSWAIREGLYEAANPAAMTNNPGAGTPSRERVLSDDELKQIWQACGDDDFGRIVKLLLLTACRRIEIGGLLWHEINFTTGMLTIPGERTKNGRALVLPLPEAALTILHSCPRRDDRDYVFGREKGGAFSSWSYSTNQLNDQITIKNGTPLAHWTLHDLRRTAATRLHDDLNCQPHIVEAVLGHYGGHRRGPAGVYNRAIYTREIAVALAHWASHLLAIVEGRKQKIVPLRA